MSSRCVAAWRRRDTPASKRELVARVRGRGDEQQRRAPARHAAKAPRTTRPQVDRERRRGCTHGQIIVLPLAGGKEYRRPGRRLRVHA